MNGKDNSREKITQTAVEEWVKSTDGVFNLRNIYSDFRAMFPEDKAHVRMIMHRLKEMGILRKEGKRDGLYCLVDNKAPEQHWQGAHMSTVPLRFPFELEKLVRILPKSLIIVAGFIGAGKTALLYNTIVLNMYDFDIHLFNSELGDSQIEERFNAIDSTIPDPPPFHIWYRQENFAEIIKPNAINVIDYLHFDEQPFMIGAELKKILDKLNEGVGIIAIQKPPGRDLGHGGIYSAMSAAVYLSMDRGKLKIVKARERAVSDVDPLNKTWGFHLDNQGANFIDISEEVERR